MDKGLKLIRQNSISRACLAVFIGLSVLAFGCATGPLGTARTQFYSGNPSGAVETLSKVTNISVRNKLLYYMEKGLMLHDLGRYEESVAVLLKASELIESQDVVSVTEQSTSLVTTEWVTRYKGEYSERLWVHTYLMMNFLILNRNDSALVEAKQALSILDERTEPLSGDFFTRALVAFCFENAREYDGALIEYKKLAEVLPGPSVIAPHLYRLSLIQSFFEDAQKYKDMISKTDLEYLEREKPTAEVVIFAGAGQIPKKVAGDIFIPPDHRFSFPRYDSVDNRMPDVEAYTTIGDLLFYTNVSTNTGRVIKASLDARKTVTIAKETARVIAKDAIADKIGDDIPALGVAFKIAFLLMEEADVRCWQTLPGSLSFLRIPVKEGHHQLKIVFSGNGIYRKEVRLPEVHLAKGERVFFSLRFNKGFMNSPEIVNLRDPDNSAQ